VKNTFFISSYFLRYAYTNRFLAYPVVGKIATNGLQLAEGGAFGAPNCNASTNVYVMF